MKNTFKPQILICILLLEEKRQHVELVGRVIDIPCIILTVKLVLGHIRINVWSAHPSHENQVYVIRDLQMIYKMMAR